MTAGLVATRPLPILYAHAHASAIARLLKGPAAATQNMSCFGRRRLAKLTGTGFAHPNKISAASRLISGTMSADQIDVTQRIQADAAGGVSRHIAEMFRDVTMRCFVKRDGKQYRQRKDSEFLNGAKLQPVLR